MTNFFFSIDGNEEIIKNKILILLHHKRRNFLGEISLWLCYTVETGGSKGLALHYI